MGRTRMKMNRRGFLTAAGAGLAASALTNTSCGKNEKQKPNIIFILADDLGYADLGCYGQQKILTPNIDRLAAEGKRFTQFYAGSPVCAPSRCVLMTGLHTGHCFVRGNKQAEPYGQLQLPSETITVAKKLKKAGYRTGCFGKWGLGVENTPGDPAQQGFDEFYGYYDQVHAHNSFPEFLYKNGKKVRLNNESTYMPKDHWTKGLGSYSTKKVDYSNDLCCDEALAFMDVIKDQPFFLYMPITMPHNNGEAPEGEKMEAPSPNPYSNKDWSNDEKNYAAMITRLDDYVGKILAKLKEIGQDQNTLILFSSDNGGLPDNFFHSNGNLRGYKRDLTEGGIRVPMIAHWPGQIEEGSTSDHIGAFWDFLPTACDIAGTTTPSDIDGISFLPELLGKKQKQHESLYWEFHWWKPGRQAVRMGNWKAIRQEVGDTPEAPIELYDLSKDISETKNIAAQHVDVVKKAADLMRSERVRSEHFQFQYEKMEKES